MAETAKARPAAPEMMRAFQHRDASYDGIFVTGVTTTGIFCRPSCPARKPKPEHVRFFAGVREALFAGFRPCKRCNPLTTGASRPVWAQSLLDDIDLQPDVRLRDGDLRARGLEPATVRRFFVKEFGMTFHAYARGRRLGGAFAQLRRGATIDDAALGSGFDSLSGFRDAFSRAFGEAPGRSRDGDCVVVTWVETPLGPMVAGARADGVCLLEYTDRRKLAAQIETVHRRFGAVVPGDSPHFAQLRTELADYFEGRLQEFTVPLVAPGTPFQERVWAELLRIPYGETRSYEEMARRVGAPGSQRAVGTANGMNRIAILIPCHRVVNKNGKLGGYGGLLWRKQALLDLERGGQRSLLAPEAAAR